MTTGALDVWAEWGRAVPALRYSSNVEIPYEDPSAAAVHLTDAGLADQYAVYEQEGVWHFAAGSAVTLTADATRVTARADGRTWITEAGTRPLEVFADALDSLRDAGHADRRFYGWSAFELAHILHGDPAAGGTGPLLHALVPCVEVSLTPGRAEIRAVDEAWARKAGELLAESTAFAARPATTGVAPDQAEQLITGSTAAYGEAVARTVADIRAGLLEKAVLSRAVPLPAVPVADFAATYLAGRRANTPARSFLIDLGGRRAAGFSPETVLEVWQDGRVSTQPLAGTRALGTDPAENSRRREELLTDPKEIHEHAVSVRLACDEMEAVCRPGSVVVEEFMAVRPRGSVQHLASRVTGRLRPGTGPWAAFASLFPAITATGSRKRAALGTLARYEEGPRGLYGGAVFRGGTDGSLDAALVLRTLLGVGDETWLRAGAGVTGQSVPAREIEETCEKLRSVAPHLRYTER
ncbi:salicylate synthase [Streptomyces atroolivaceus]|uniref:salicylate synthase n=1 Tax=Streptomyces atroolivaceus TaxID=66869 RepID=UPI00202547C1|nr:salicylate synthase [Streptomyces atroolivaceus]